MGQKGWLRFCCSTRQYVDLENLASSGDGDTHGLGRCRDVRFCLKGKKKRGLMKDSGNP